MKEKTDAVLGRKVHEHLVNLGLESPFNFDIVASRTENEKIDLIKGHMEQILDILGIDQTNDSVQDTASRVAKMYVRETMWGMDYNNFPKIMTFENKMGYNEMVTERSTSDSLCSHHLVPILGKVVVSYVPASKVIGLSKLNRIVEFFSRRPQEAERMTEQIAATMKFILETEDVAVMVKGKHLCVSWRGVGDEDAVTMTSHLGGCYRKPEVRQELMSIANTMLVNCQQHLTRQNLIVGWLFEQLTEI